MKKYTKLMACEIELQAKENIALNPISATAKGAAGVVTVYDISLFGSNSKPDVVVTP